MTTTNQGDEMEASMVKVGSRVTMTMTNDFSGEVLEVLTDGHLKIRWTFSKTGNVSTDSHWEASDVGNGLVVIAAPVPADWSKWLPPHPLPDTGPKEFKAGQVWAMHMPSGFIGVCRINNTPECWSNHDCESLAGKEGITKLGQDSRAAKYAVLVQDIDEPHPRDPATLWASVAMPGSEILERMGWKPGTSNLPKPALGPPPAPTKPKCSGCDQERDLGATGKCWDCYVVDDKAVALRTDGNTELRRRLHSERIKRTLMQPATLDPLWQRNPNVGVWRLR